MDRKELITIIRVLLLVVAFFLIIAIIAAIQGYDDYHTRMHGTPTWGRVVNNNVHLMHSGLYSRIEYEVDSTTYCVYIPQLSPIRLMDSVLVYYDTTCPKHAIVPMRSPKNSDSAFFLSEKRLTKSRWEDAYEKYQRQLELDRQAHRERKLFYDHFCKDD